MFAKGFHQFGTMCNALDIAPKHSGSVFGLMNTAGSSAGATETCTHSLDRRRTLFISLKSFAILPLFAKFDSV